MYNIEELIKEDNLNIGNEQFRNYIFNKYELSKTIYWNCSSSEHCHPIREIWLYQLITKKNGYRIIEHRGFIEFKDKNLSYNVFLWCRKTKDTKASRFYTIRAHSLQEFYELQNTLIKNCFYSIDRQSEDFVKDIFTKKQNEKIIDLEQKLNELRTLTSNISNIQIETTE